MFLHEILLVKIFFKLIGWCWLQATGFRIGTILSSIVSLVAALVIAFYYGWKLALVVLGGVPILMLSSEYITGSCQCLREWEFSLIWRHFFGVIESFATVRFRCQKKKIQISRRTKIFIVYICISFIYTCMYGNIYNIELDKTYCSEKIWLKKFMWAISVFSFKGNLETFCHLLIVWIFILKS